MLFDHRQYVTAYGHKNIPANASAEMLVCLHGLRLGAKIEDY